MTSDREEKFASFLDVLSLVSTGKATVTVGGAPVLFIDADRKTLDVEATGVEQAGLRLKDLVRLGGQGGMLKGSAHLKGALSRLGWRLNLSADGETLLSMGSGVSRLTGRIRVDPLRLRKLLRALK